MKKIIYITIFILLVLTGCNNEDEIEYTPVVVPTHTPTPTNTPPPTATPTQEIIVITPTPNLKDIKAEVMVTDIIIPYSIAYGNYFRIGATIDVSVGNIQKINGVILDAENNVINKIEKDEINANRYRIYNEYIDRGLKFETLEKGWYQCVIKAEGTNFTETEILSFAFIIGDKTQISEDFNNALTSEQYTKNNMVISILNSTFPLNCHINTKTKTTNDNWTEIKEISSIYDTKSVAHINTITDRNNNIKAEDSYITTVNKTLKLFTYIPNCGWKNDSIAKSSLNPNENEALTYIRSLCESCFVNENIDKIILSEDDDFYTIRLLNHSIDSNYYDSSVVTDMILTVTKNYYIKRIDISITNTYSADSNISNKTRIKINIDNENISKVEIPEEVLTDEFDTDEYVNYLIEKYYPDMYYEIIYANNKIQYIVLYDYENESSKTITYKELQKKSNP